MSKITSLYVSALIKKYEAEISEAEAGLELYLSGANLAAIGEHSNLLEEQDRFIAKLSDTKGKLDIILKYEAENNKWFDGKPVKKINS